MDECKAALQDESLMVVVGYDKDKNMFYLQWKNDETQFFEATMFKENFEALTSRMIRLIKDVNLLEAEEYKRRKEAGECTADLTENRQIPQQVQDEQKA